MLHRIEELEGFTIHAKDGEIGSVEDAFFDDEKWVVRYLVVRTGSWLFGKEVLISPVSIKEIDWHGHEVEADLTAEEVKNSPSVEMEKPISKQQEYEFNRYFGIPVYWGGAGLWGNAMYPGAIFIPPEEHAEELEEMKKRYNHHLRSVVEVRRYRIDTRDDELGRVEDFIIDDDTMAVRYMEIKTGGLFDGKHVLVSPRWIENVNWGEEEVRVNLSTEKIKDAPEYDPTNPIDREYEDRLFEHYGSPKYWLEEG
jgi:sporulation protein YlmC with PRC-barrel domain